MDRELEKLDAFLEKILNIGKFGMVATDNTFVLACLEEKYKSIDSETEARKHLTNFLIYDNPLSLLRLTKVVNNQYIVESDASNRTETNSIFSVILASDKNWEIVKKDPNPLCLRPFLRLPIKNLTPYAEARFYIQE